MRSLVAAGHSACPAAQFFLRFGFAGVLTPHRQCRLEHIRIVASVCPEHFESRSDPIGRLRLLDLPLSIQPDRLNEQGQRATTRPLRCATALRLSDESQS